MVDWYMLGTMLTVSNQLILWKLPPAPQRLANFNEHFLSNVSSTFFALVFDTPCHMRTQEVLDDMHLLMLVKWYPWKFPKFGQ